MCFPNSNTLICRFSRTLLLSVCVCFLSNAFGQNENLSKVSFGIHIAATGATVYAKDLRKQQDDKYLPILGVVAGVETQFAVKPKFLIIIETNFERKGQKIFFTKFDIKSSVYRDYVTLPIITKFILSDRKAKIFLNAGAYGGYFLKLHYKIESLTTPGGEWTTYTPDPKYNNMFDFGLVTGLGAETIIKKNYQLGLELRNNLGLAGINKNDVFASTNAKNESFSLLFRFRYNLNKKK